MRNIWKQERNDRERDKERERNLIRPAGGNEEKRKHRDKT
jgi:hypothetical protein